MRSQPSCVEPLRPECPICMHSLAFEFAWQKSAMRRKASRCASFHRPVQPGVMRPSAEVQVISTYTRPARPMARLPRCTKCQSPGTPSTAEYWSMGETTTRFSTTMSRRRNGVNIGTGGGGEVDVEALRLHLLRKPPVYFLDEPWIAQLQVLPGDLLGARHDAEGELLRLHVPVALHVLEPRK